MYDHIEERVLETASYIVDTGATVRKAASRFGVSKSTVHKDMHDRLPGLDKVLSGEVAKVLAKNKEERHIRGGQATREKYLS